MASPKIGFRDTSKKVKEVSTKELERRLLSCNSRDVPTIKKELEFRNKL